MTWKLELNFLPILERELRRLARRPLTYRARSAAGFGAALISLGVLAVNVISGGDSTIAGRQMFVMLALLSFGFSVMTGPVLTADCLCEEKRNGTLGLLFLTNLNGFHVVAGKLVAMALPAAHCLLAVFPILAISFWMGGVTGEEFFRTSVVLSSTLLFSLATGLLASALCVDGRKALAGAIVFLLIVTLGLPALELIRHRGFFPTHSLPLLASPGYVAWQVPEAHYVLAVGWFWGALTVNFALSYGMLWLAGYLLPQSWQDKPSIALRNETPSAQQSQEIRIRSERRQKLLATNPILWLADRNHRNKATVWFFLGAVVVIWLAGSRLLPRAWFDSSAVFVIVYCLHTVIKLWVGWESGRRFAEDRSSGSLELLLCTPLEEGQILSGWLTYLRQRFLAPVLSLFFIDVMLMATAMGNAGGLLFTFFVGMGLFLTDTYTLCWVGLWQGLTARGPMVATLNTFLYVLLLPMLACSVVFIAVALLAPAKGAAPIGSLTATWFAVGYLTDAALCAKAMTRLKEQFRVAVIEGLAGQRAIPVAQDQHL